MTSIWWIRRDLRLTDNQALTEALRQGGDVLPLFVLDPALLESSWVGEKRTAFLLGGLRALDADLRSRGSRLIVRRGNPQQVLPQLIAESGATAVFAERDHSPFARQRDAAVDALVPLTLTDGVSVHAPGLIRSDVGTPYTVFTPFSRRWKSLPAPTRADIFPAPQQISTPAEIISETLPEAPWEETRFPPGEAEARRRLAAFVSGDLPSVYDYANQRNRPDLDGASALSPYLRFGMISPRLAALGALTAMQRAPSADARTGAESWLNELIWREFYINILHDFPHVRRGSFRPAYDTIPWANNPADFDAWRAGQTGYPFIDAAMRQLTATGWMHNRTRMAVASFLVKDLLIDWRWGERWFMQRLLDGDPAANNGGWQWTAGVGTDAAPYFRIFNPVAQGQKFDPNGDFVRRWLPELARVPLESIHAPWTLSRSNQVRAGVEIGRDYPAPIVDHAWARSRVLAVYKSATAQSERGRHG